MTENNIKNETNGNIKISDEVIITIASVAVSEIEGASCVNGTLNEIAQKFGKKNFAKGIKVTVEEEITLDVNIVVDYGVKIPEVAWNVQDNVKKSVELMSGLTVGRVNVHVVDVAQKKQDEAPAVEAQDEADAQEE
ncbi:MAG: Asp23/Gls24 family envelope stress response protein [Clostridia bacterium]|nr:Asp23/Gls24 family envelope stress response protein [Clostridia bacterium]